MADLSRFRSFLQKFFCTYVPTYVRTYVRTYPHTFYRQGLQEFLAACEILEPSANIQAQDGAFAEGGAEGPRRIMFDVENISEHENAAVTGGGRTQGLYAFFAHQS